MPLGDTEYGIELVLQYCRKNPAQTSLYQDTGQPC